MCINTLHMITLVIPVGEFHFEVEDCAFCKPLGSVLAEDEEVSDDIGVS